MRRPKSNGSQENSAPAALPQTLCPEADGSTGPDIAGITDCGRTCPKMLLAVARFDCHSESSRGRYADLRDLDAGLDALTLLERRPHRGIVVAGVLDGLFERERLPGDLRVLRRDGNRCCAHDRHEYR